MGTFGDKGHGTKPHHQPLQHGSGDTTCLWWKGMLPWAVQLEVLSHWEKAKTAHSEIYARSDPKFKRAAILNLRPKRSEIYARSEPAPCI